MRTPSDYTTTSFFGLHIMVVDAGTVITDERTGEEFTISDRTAVRKGTTIFCVQSTYDSMKRQAQ